MYYLHNKYEIRRDITRCQLPLSFINFKMFFQSVCQKTVKDDDGVCILWHI